MNTFWTTFKKALKGWKEDEATNLCAALAYYTVFSIAPLVLISVAIAGLFFGHEAATGEIFRQINGLVGEDAAKSLQAIVEASALKESSILATMVGIATLLVGSTSAFAQLQDSLNKIWKVRPKPSEGIKSVLRQRLLSFSLILVIAFLLLVSLVATAALSAIGSFASTHLPGGEAIWQVVNLIVSFGFTTLLFASIYKILPDVKLNWSHVWTGALMTSFLFTVGKSLIGIYLGHSGVTSTYGAAGSIVVVLLWTYYSSAVLLLGAEYTRFRSISDHHRPDLKIGAEWIQQQQISVTADQKDQK